ncbi:crotonase/enoyl-CoA hydratase family protein [Nonomuraea sp. NPDC047529]|uniref:crotonase/enoyl-CoA hydratase family protein n=1 Tax=Nonomuraea sp. NPDC047529 TaxID=3155623 RepID=UPI0033D60D6C
MIPPCPDLPPSLAPSLALERHGDVAVLSLNRPAKRNALDEATIAGLGAFFAAPPPWAMAAVLAAEGAHFSAGLDLGELTVRDAVGGLHHSRGWHEAMDRIGHGVLPVIAVLKGAVIGGGLELAAAAHLRVAEESAFFAFPEGSRGLFVGGGASVRVSRLIGAQPMIDMMLTGRVLTAAEGEARGLVDYRVAEGDGITKALALARQVIGNSPIANYAVLHALPRIADADAETGLLLESLMSAVAQSSTEAKARIQDFLDGRAAKVGPPGAAR